MSTGKTTCKVGGLSKGSYTGEQDTYTRELVRR